MSAALFALDGAMGAATVTAGESLSITITLSELERKVFLITTAALPPAFRYLIKC